MLTEADVRALLGTEVPVHRMFLGEFDTWAIGDDLVAKFPRTAYDAAKVPLEVAVHPILRELLGDVVPAIRSTGRMRDGSAYVVHERARGTQGQTDGGSSITPGEELAADVGVLLGRIHAVDAATASGWRLGERQVSYETPNLGDHALSFAARTLGERLDTFLAAPPPLPPARRVLCHTDLKGEHVFVSDDRSRVTAIIDWADTEICDPARDYAGLAIWLGPAFALAAVEASDEDDDGLADRGVWLARAGTLEYWDDVLTGKEDAPRDLITAQLVTAFGDQ